MKSNSILVWMLCGTALATAPLTLLLPGDWGSDLLSPAEAREDHADHDHTGHAHDGSPAEETGSIDAHDYAEDAHGDKAEQDHVAEGHDGELSAPETDDHEGHEGHEGHDDHGSVDLTPDQMETFDVRTATVSGGPVSVTIERPAEVVYDENTLAHVVPRVPGIARTINAAEGDRVTEGDVLAILESRELADAKAAYLASLERLSLAKENFARAEALIDKRIVSEKNSPRSPN